MDERFWRDAGNLMVVAAGVPAFIFPIVYTVTFKWWRSRLGRALFFKALGLSELVVLSILRIWFHEETWWVVVRAVVLANVAGGLWYQMFAFFGVRRQAKEEQRRQAIKDYLAQAGFLRGHGEKRDQSSS